MNVTPVMEAIEKLKEYLLECQSDSNYQELFEDQKISVKISEKTHSLNLPL